MHIAICGPISLKLMKDDVDGVAQLPSGYLYPFAAFLAKEYLKAGHNVSIVTSVDSVLETCKWTGDRCSIVVTPRRARARDLIQTFYRREVGAMATALKQLAPDVIHAQWTYEFADAALRTGIPTLVTARDSPWRIAWLMKQPYRLLRAFYAQFAILPRIKYLSTISPYMIRELRRGHGVFRPIYLVPNGIDKGRMNPSPVMREGKIDSPRIMSVSDWGPRKNIITTLEAFKLIQASRANAQLTLVGNGLGADGPAEIYCRQNKIPTRDIRFLGYQAQDHILDLLRNETDIFLHTTLEESFCVTILEAMAQGVPCIGGSGSGAIPWLLDEGIAGKLVNVGAASAVADAVSSLCDDPDARRKIAGSGYRRVNEHFLLDQVARKYLEIFDQIMLASKNILLVRPC
jgi:glycosyltransferase involved in cell wall biosynthesis